MKLYRKKTLQPMRPYAPGEILDGVFIPDGIEPEEGGMIAVNATDINDQWYITKAYFEEFYEEHVEDEGKI